MTTEAQDGTARGLHQFLGWAEEKGELAKPVVVNWRGAVTAVLSIEDNWETLDIRKIDIESFLSRFETLRRTNYKSDSMRTYKSRFQRAVESYRLWLDNKPEWKPGPSSRPPITRVRGNGSGGKESIPKEPTAEGTSHRHDPLRVVPTAGMIDHTLPLRPGVYARLALPENLTTKDAKRVAAFVTSLAFEEQLALTAGSSED